MVITMNAKLMRGQVRLRTGHSFTERESQMERKVEEKVNSSQIMAVEETLGQ